MSAFDKAPENIVDSPEPSTLMPQAAVGEPQPQLVSKTDTAQKFLPDLKLDTPGNSSPTHIFVNGCNDPGGSFFKALEGPNTKTINYLDSIYLDGPNPTASYDDSVADGANQLKSDIEQRDPSKPLTVEGYSLGAEVVHEAFRKLGPGDYSNVKVKLYGDPENPAHDGLPGGIALNSSDIPNLPGISLHKPPTDFKGAQVQEVANPDDPIANYSGNKADLAPIMAAQGPHYQYSPEP